MRRLLRLALLAPLLLPLACTGPEAQPETPVARVEGWTLTEDRLADLLVLAQPLPLDSLTVRELVNEWVARAALAQRSLEGFDLLGEELREVSLWLEEREALALADPAVRAASQVTAQEAQRVFESDSLRLYAHVLRRTDASTSPEERELQRRTAQEILNGLLQGGSWPAAVARSEDLTNRESSGLLGLLTPAELPRALQTAGRQLQPGQVSAVVQSPLGFHILYRPALADVADLFQDLLRERRRAEAEARLSRQLRDELALEPGADALAAVRSFAAEDAPLPPDGGAPVLTWEGGELDRGTLARYVVALPPEARSELLSASDEDVGAFVTDLGLREARLQRLRAAGTTPDPDRMVELRALHEEELRSWSDAVPTQGGGEESRQALRRYMERLVSRQVEVPPLPPLVARWARTPLSWEVDEAAMSRAIEAARQMAAAAAQR